MSLPLNITMTVEGVPILSRSFYRVGQRLSDLRPIWDNVQRTFWEIETEQFRSEGAKGASGAWAPLSWPYKKEKAQKWGVRTILWASGRMMESLTGQTADTVLLKEAQEFGIGTSLDYPKYHQTGTDKMLKRPVIDFSDESKRTLSKDIQRDIIAEIRKDPEIKLEVT